MDVVDEGYVLGRSVRLCGSWVRLVGIDVAGD